MPKAACIRQRRKSFNYFALSSTWIELIFVPFLCVDHHYKYNAVSNEVQFGCCQKSKCLVKLF